MSTALNTDANFGPSNSFMRFVMKSIRLFLLFNTLILVLLGLVSCNVKTADTDKELIPKSEITGKKETEEVKDNTLPVRYQAPAYMVGKQTREELDMATDDVALKVGANITSTVGPQPLIAILKQLANLKEMNVSWASDVDQSVLVDVDISANDDFFQAIDNLLRQVDYFHQIKGNTIIVKFKETKRYHVAMPFIKQSYETATGGNMLGSEETASNIEGTIQIDSRGNEFDIWKNIEDNLNSILEVWTTEAVTTISEEGQEGTDTTATTDETATSESSTSNTLTKATRQRSQNTNTFFIDKPVGVITVTAPRPLQIRIDDYFKKLKSELYKQVAIEAKIIEVQLMDHSSIGLNWNLILSNLSLGAQLKLDRVRSDATTDTKSSVSTSNSSTTRGRNRTYDYLATDSLTADTGSYVGSSGSTITDTSNVTVTIADTITNTFGGTIGLATFNFDDFINVLEEQGKTTILSNPKLSVLNGQPALLTVGRNVTYIDAVESNVSEAGIITYTFHTERVLSGVGMSLTANIFDGNKVILNLVPVIAQLEEPIEYRYIGTGQVGLPVINVREMSTTVTINDGEMLVIGGLIRSAKDKDGTFMPLLGKIPLIRYLFGYEEKTLDRKELIILLRPKII